MTEINQAPSRGRLLRRALEAVLLWIGLMLVLSVAYELVDRLWVEDVPEQTRRTAYVVRIIAMSLTATVVTAVYVLWRRTPSLHRSLSAAPPEHPSAAQRSLAQWLLGLRWVAMLVLAAVVAASTIGTGRVPDASTLPLWAGVGMLFLANGLLSIADHRWRSRSSVLVAQLLFDVIVIGWLIHHAGGLMNPFAGLFVFHSVIAAVVLRPPVARGLAVGITSLVLLLTALEASGLAPPACLRDAAGVCRPPDWLHLAAAGIGVATLTMGCGLFVTALVRVLGRERDRLADARGALLEEQDKLQSIIDCMADAVIFASPDGRILLKNHAADALWAEPPPVGQELTVCHSPETWAQLKDKLHNAGPHEVHPILQVGDRSYEGNFARVCGEDGQLKGVVMVARDVTERLAAQDWRMRRERMAVVGKMAATVAHELNNPLGSITLFTQHALKAVPEKDPLADHLSTVLTNAKQCSKIVRDLLTYARQRPPERSDITLGKPLRDAVRTLEYQAERQGVEVTLEGDVDDITVFGDPDQLRQVLVNLGLNAIEAMDGGGLLCFGADVRGNMAEIRVADTGPGIAPEDRDKVFSAFHTTKADGTGLGLAVARDLVAAHGGDIELESEPGQGCTFRVRIPLDDQARAVEAAE